MYRLSQEHALEQLELAKKALDYASEGITIADFRLDDMPLIYVNKGFERLTGYSEEEVVGKNCRFLQGKETQQAELDLLRAALKEGTQCSVLLKNYKKDGTLFYNQLNVAPIIDKEGNLTHYVGVQSDVTDIVLREKQLNKLNEELKKSNEELQKLNSQLNEIQSMAAHDIKNPLSNIMSTVELIQLFIEKDKLSESKLIEQLNNINKTSRRMLNIITDFLEVKKIDSGAVNYSPENSNIISLLEVVVNQYKTQASKKSIDLILENNSKIEQLNIDQYSFNTVFDNLISNAIKYSENNKEVKVTIENSETEVIISVKDNGNGISQEDQKKLFKHFQKLSNKPTGGESSTGLGLFIVKKNVEMMNAVIEVDSEINKGTTFKVIFKIN
jgi:PAS domain S-box-containing protein